MFRSLLVSVCFAVPTFVLAQNQGDPQALAFAAQSIAAIRSVALMDCFWDSEFRRKLK